jgi:hypothetical protein
VSELISVVWRVGGASGGVGEAGDAELDGVGAAGADLVRLGEFDVRAGAADLETLGLAIPAVGLGRNRLVANNYEGEPNRAECRCGIKPLDDRAVIAQSAGVDVGAECRPLCRGCPASSGPRTRVDG